MIKYLLMLFICNVYLNFLAMFCFKFHQMNLWKWVACNIPIVFFVQVTLIHAFRQIYLLKGSAVLANVYWWMISLCVVFFWSIVIFHEGINYRYLIAALMVVGANLVIRLFQAGRKLRPAGFDNVISTSDQ